MKLRWKFAKPSLNQIVGIAVCAAAASPMILTIATISDVLRGMSFAESVWVYGTLPILDLMLGCAVISLLALPTVMVIAIGAYALAATKYDTFMISTACSAVIGYVALSITFELAFGTASMLEFRDSYDIQEAVLLIVLASLLSSLYWIVAVRRDRHRRQASEEHERALRAME